jgi:hypothetical protein
LAYTNNIDVSAVSSVCGNAGLGGGLSFNPLFPTSVSAQVAGAGANGAVRIIWPGNLRSFPSTNVSSAADSAAYTAGVTNLYSIGSYNLPTIPNITAATSGSSYIVVRVNSVTNVSPGIPTYATVISLNTGSLTQTFLNTSTNYSISNTGVLVFTTLVSSTGTVIFSGLSSGNYTVSAQSYNAVGYSITTTTSGLIL